LLSFVIKYAIKNRIIAYFYAKKGTKRVLFLPVFCCIKEERAKTKRYALINKHQSLKKALFRLKPCKR